MLWMCIWMCPHHVTAAHVDQACGVLPQIWASLSWHLMVKWGDWGCRPNPYSSHIHIIYIKCVWLPLYAVDVHMDVSTPRYGRSCRPSLWNFATNLGKSQLIYDGNEVIEAVDPTHIHLTSILYIYIRCLTTIICCGCAYGCVPTTYCRSCRPSFWNFVRNLGYSQAITHGEMRWLRL